MGRSGREARAGAASQASTSRWSWATSKTHSCPEMASNAAPRWSTSTTSPVATSTSSERPLYLGQPKSQHLDAAPDALDRDAAVDESLRCPQGDEVSEGVAVMAADRGGHGRNEIGVRPVLQLAARDPEDLHDLSGPEEPAGFPSSGYTDRHETHPPTVHVRPEGRPRSCGKSTKNAPFLCRFAVG